MPIKVTCPNGHAMNVKDSFAGKVGLCPVCRAKVKVPKLPGGMSEDDIISVLGPHEPGLSGISSLASSDSFASSSSIFSSSEKGSGASYSGIGGSSGIGLGSSSGIGLGGSRIETSSPPKKTCTSCRREISSGTHICPFCRTYIANLSDL
jgi:hypothetical protein